MSSTIPSNLEGQSLRVRCELLGDGLGFLLGDAWINSRRIHIALPDSTADEPSSLL